MTNRAWSMKPGIVLFLVIFWGIIGCTSQKGEGEADNIVLSLQTFNEQCRLCHSEGSIADVADRHALETKDVGGTITGAGIAGGILTVNFKLYDSDNSLIPISGVSSSAIRFTVAKLNPATDNWQSYINRTEVRDASDPGTTADGNPEVQATSETTTKGTLTDNGDGTYSYQFSIDMTAVTTPTAVTYDATATHRVALQTTGNTSNAYYDFVPDTSPVTNTRSIAMNASCNECHIRLGLHGGDRITVAYCVTCHNPGSTDAHSGNTVDFNVMIHKIHMGESLPEVQAGGKYSIFGFNDTEHNYSEVVYPQDIRNCTKCHDGNDSGTADGDNWKNNPTTSACISCHEAKDATNFPLLTAQEITDAHVIPEQVAAAKLQFNLISVANTAPGEYPAITFSVTDPTNSNNAYDIYADPEFTASGGVSSLALLIGWDTNDYNNTDSGRTPAQPMNINVLTSGAAASNGDGTYTATSSVAIPLGATGSGVVALQGHPAGASSTGQYTLRLPVKSVVKYFAITDTTATARREIVDLTKCQACHQSISLHGSNRNNEIKVCVICHNANATDISVRLADTALMADGKVEETIDFKNMIHGIHAAEMRENGLVIYGFRSSENDFSHVLLPAGEENLKNCQGCHISGTSVIPIDQNALPTTIGTGNNISSPDDDSNITPTASACSACHDDILSKTHMADEGANFNFILYEEASDDASTSNGPSGTQPPGHSSRTDCSTCHG